MKKLNLTDKRNPDYFYSEAIKTLRTNIQLSGQSIKTILITSCYPNEGKSDIVLSLAQELGSIGKKVLLLDADIRKTAYAGRLGVEEEVKGLSQLLSGQVGLQEVIYSTNFPNMDIIFGGPSVQPSHAFAVATTFSLIWVSAMAYSPSLGNLMHLFSHFLYASK